MPSLQRFAPCRAVTTVALIQVSLLAMAVAPSPLRAADPSGPPLPAAPASRPITEKRLIEFGWDEPDTAFMRQHVAEMEATPFDGCVFHTNYLKGEGDQAKNTGGFLWECWGKRSFKASELQASLDDLKATPFKRFTQNFLRFNTAPGDVDWFDDFGPVVNNARLAARIAKEGRCRGILFDIEQYNKKLWYYPEQLHVKDVKDPAQAKSWDEYAAQVRRRGREVMAAFQQEFPDAVIFLTFGYSLPYAQAGKDPAKLAKASYGLLAPFLDGMLDVAEGNIKLVDGHELSYGYKDTSKFATAYKTMQSDVLPFVEAGHDKYRRFFSFGFGVWLDDDWRRKGWDVEDPSKNYYPPDAFERSVHAALLTADEYVWVYSETPRWWSAGGKPVKLPKAYEDALRRARKQSGQAAGQAGGPADSAQNRK